MSSPENQLHEPVEDTFDELLRHALQRGTPFCQPPPRVWQRIRSQVTAGPAPTSHRPPTERLGRLFAPLVQGLSAAVIFILVGVSLGTTRTELSQQASPSRPQAIPVAPPSDAREDQMAVAQRLGRFAAADDASDYGLSQSRQQRKALEIAHTARLRGAISDSDIEVMQTHRYVLEDPYP